MLQSHSAQNDFLKDIDVLPPFANEENRALDRENRIKEEKLTRLVNGLEEQTRRSNAMTEHMKHVRQEIHYTQALYDARIREIDTESHFKLLAERETGRLKQDFIRLEKDISNITDQINLAQNTIHNDSEKMELLRNDMRIGKEELEEWLRVQQEKEEDNLALEKYSKEDEHRMKELDLQIQKLVHDVNLKKKQLAQEMTETQISQMELQKTAENFRRVHLERQDLLRQWENAIKAMKRRDEDIRKNQQQYQVAKEDMNEVQNRIAEKKAEIESLQEVIDSLEKEILTTEKHVSKLKSEHNHAKTELNLFQDELDMLKKTLHKTSADINQKKSEISDLNKEVLEKKEKHDKQQERLTSAQKRLDEMKATTSNLEDRNAELQEMIRQDEARSKDLDRDIKSIKSIRKAITIQSLYGLLEFKRNQELAQMNEQKKIYETDITAAKNVLRNMVAKASKLDQDAMKQQSLLYTQSYLIQQLERKIRRAQGERTGEEKEILNQKIVDLSAQLDEWRKKNSTLSTQYKKATDDLRQTKRNLANLEKERTLVNEQISEISLYNESAASQLAAKIREKEELMVDENILRLELKKLRSFLNARADSVLSLENRQAHLQLALEERSKEIEIHKDMLKAHIKTVEEERYSAMAELRERVSKVEKLKSKYEIIMTQLATEDGEEHSQAFFMIKASQRKEEIQREGDVLDSKIKRMEKEVIALEKTLQALSSRNETFRLKISGNEIQCEDVEKKANLENQYHVIYSKAKQKKKKLQELQEQLYHTEQALAALADDESSKLNDVNNLESQIREVDIILDEYARKKERAEKHCSKLSREWREANESPHEMATPEELDIDIKSLRDFNKMLMIKLSEVAGRHPEIESRFHQLCQESALAPPSRSSSNSPSRVISRQSVNRSVVGTPTSSGRQSAISSPVTTKSFEFQIGTASTGPALPRFPSRNSSAARNIGSRNGFLRSRNVESTTEAIAGKGMLTKKLNVTAENEFKS